MSPEWLNEDYLKEQLQNEQVPESGFVPLPFRWLEISTVLIDAYVLKIGKEILIY